MDIRGIPLASGFCYTGCMPRTLLVLLVGVLAGAAATYYLVPVRHSRFESATPAAVGDVPLVDARSVRSVPAPAGRPPEIAERMSIYELAVDANAAELEWRIEEAAQAPSTRTRQFTFEVLFARLAEIDPERAARVAADLELDMSLLSPLLQVLADVDKNAAERALEDALTRALSLEDAVTRGRALGEVAKSWVGLDRRGALDRIDLIDDAASRDVFRYGVLQEWSKQDPIAAFEYAATLESSPRLAMQWLRPAVQELEGADPREILAMVTRLPRETANIARQIGMQLLASQDPRAALAYVDELPAADRQALLRQIASAYGRADPDAALIWARSVRPPIPGLIPTVLSGVAQADPERAFDLALAQPPMDRTLAIQFIVGTATASGRGDARAMAEKLLSLPDSSDAEQQALQAVIASWAARDGEAALEWLLANRDRVRSDAFRGMASAFAQQDPESAALYVDQVPSAVRTEWISAVAVGYARADPQLAVTWLARFRGDPAYEPGTVAAAQGLAAIDPPAAVRLLDVLGAGAEVVGSAATMIAMQWAQRDPPAAAQWAGAIGAPELRDAALGTVAQQWAAIDVEAARGWVLGLPNGATRDRALGSMIAAVANTETPDSRLLSAFSNDLSRQQALLMALYPMIQRDPVGAQAFVDQYFTDPTLRQQAESILEGQQGGRPFGIDSFGVVQGPGFVIRSGSRP